MEADTQTASVRQSRADRAGVKATRAVPLGKPGPNAVEPRLGGAKAREASAREKTARAQPAAKAPDAAAVRPAARLREVPLRRPRPAPLRHLSARVEDVLIHAVERPARGRGARSRAVVLIHGAGVDHRDWTFGFMNKIDPRWRVLAFDRPGFGASGRPSGAASALPATQARILLKAAREFGVEQTVVVGHSWGGAVAMAWGLAAPEETLGVASLAGAVAPWSLSNAIKNGRRIQSAARTALGDGLRAAALEAMAESFAPDPVPRGYAAHMETELNPLSGPTAATMADVSTINGALALMTPHYAGFDRPVELVYSDADAILSPEEQGQAAAALLPRARLTVLRGAGHMIHHTRPRPCLAALERLFSAVGR